MKIFFVRHGETDWNVRKMFYGWTDCDINETGLKQAQALGDHFKEIEIDGIYASDLLRAKHTAQFILGEKQIPFITDKDFREIHFGDWEDTEWKYIKENFSKELEAWRIGWKDGRLPNGESFKEFYRRVTIALEKVIEANKGKTIVVVSHHGTMAAMLCYLTGAGPDGYWNFIVVHIFQTEEEP